MSWTNYHSHCHYCDGKMSPEENLLAAVEQGVKIYGFSSHCPVPFENKWSINREKLPDYLEEIEELKKKFAEQIEVYKSMEIDYIPGIISPVSDIIQQSKLDYTLGSVHFANQFDDGRYWEIDSTTPKFKLGVEEIYKGDVQKAVVDYYERIRMMVREARPDIVGHLDKIKIHNSNEYFFDEEDSWYKNEVNKTLEEIKSAGSIIEVNTRGMYKKLVEEPYPGKSILREIKEMNIPICLNSDSHQPDDITKKFPETAELLYSIGFQKMRILHQGEWVDMEFDKNGLKI